MFARRGSMRGMTANSAVISAVMPGTRNSPIGFGAKPFGWPSTPQWMGIEASAGSWVHAQADSASIRPTTTKL